MITDERAEKALDFLMDTSVKIANLRGEFERSEILRKRVRKKVFLASTGTVAERDALAESDPETHAADDAYIHAIKLYESLKAKREIESIALDVWRTEQASKRKGFM